jgi:cytochrome c oxidase subunit IV
MASHAAHLADPANPPKANTAPIWRTFWILLIATSIEFLVAFTVEAKPLRVSIFVGLTFVKAFYIIAEFMHLKHEVKMLIWSVALPTLFVVWLLIALLYEGSLLYAN